MMKQLVFLFLLSLIFLLHCTTTFAQSIAGAPAPPGPTNITAILEKGGQFTSFIRLLKNSQEADQINQQLNNSNSGLTVFAPTDNAFSSLKSGTLNSLSDQQKVQLIQFHILPTYIPQTQFQTVSNPLRTQAGDTSGYPLNVTSSGNQVNITTGVVNATVANSVYSDGQLAVYQVDQVLLPMALFGPTPAPAPAPTKAEKDVPIADSPTKGSDDDTKKADASGAMGLRDGSFGVLMIAAFYFWL